MNQISQSIINFENTLDNYESVGSLTREEFESEVVEHKQSLEEHAKMNAIQNEKWKEFRCQKLAARKEQRKQKREARLGIQEQNFADDDEFFNELENEDNLVDVPEAD